jgi:hypothetical protein
MIANPGVPYPGAAPQHFTLNDLRVHETFEEEPSSTSALVWGLLLAAALAIGAFVWLDPLRLFTSTNAGPPAPSVASAEPARPTETQGTVAPLATAPAMKPLEAPITQAPAVQAPTCAAPLALPRAANAKPEARSKQMDKTNTTVAQASPKTASAAPKPGTKTAPTAVLTEPEKTAAPTLLTKAEEKTDAPIAPKLGDDAKTPMKPAATNDQAAAPEEAK